MSAELFAAKLAVAMVTLVVLAWIYPAEADLALYKVYVWCQGVSFPAVLLTIGALVIGLCLGMIRS